MESGRKNFITDTLFSLISPVAQNLSTLIVLIFITKHIGAEGYGIWSQFFITVVFASVFVHLNFGHAMNRFFVGVKDNKYISSTFYALLTIVVSLAVLIGVIIILFQERIADFLFGSVVYAPLVVLIAAFLILRNLNAEHGALLRARRYMKFLAVTDMWYFSAVALWVTVAVFFTRDIFWIIATLLFIEAALLIAYAIFIRGKGILIARPNFSNMIPLLRFGPPLIITSMGYWVVQLSDRYIIGYFMDISDVGLYAVSYGIAVIILMFWVAFQAILLPDLSALYDSGGKKELELRFSRVLKYGMAVSMASVAGFVVLAKPILVILSSAKFAEVSTVLIVVSAGIFCYGIFMHFSVLLNVLKKVKVLNIFWLSMAITNVLLNLFLIPVMGIMGAAYSTLLVFIFGMIAIIFYTRLYFSISFPISWIFKMAIASFLMAYIVHFIPISSAVTLLVAVGVGVILYGSMLFFFRFSDISEITLLKNFLKK